MGANQQRFGSRLGMMLAMLGMAVGTGNIWRFPRIAASNGGGEFLVAWIVFLFMWSIPLILLEFGLGRMTRSGPIRAFVQVMGPRWAWMGAFAVFVTTAITYYYSVVAGWTVCYSFASATGQIPEEVPGSFWRWYTGSWWPILTHGIVFGATILVVARGVRIIERVTSILMPTLILLVLILTIRAVMLPGASAGLGFLFEVDWSRLAEPTIWIAALAQNAWDTGAGWGLVLCYAAYMREKEDTALNAFILPIANNLISLLAAVMVFCTVFSVVPQIIEQAKDSPENIRALNEKLYTELEEGKAFSPELMQDTVFSEGNEGITFVWMPQLFRSMPGGSIFMFLFFLALSVAAFTSMIAMVEVTTRAFVDAGFERKKVIWYVGGIGFLLGIPSALSMQVFQNQDWVWAVALMLSGLFFAICIIKYGVDRFRRDQINQPNSNIKVGVWWDIVIGVLVPLQAVFLAVWLLVDSWRSNPDGWWRPLGPVNVGTVLFQFAVVLVVLLLLNNWIARKSAPNK